MADTAQPTENSEHQNQPIGESNNSATLSQPRNEGESSTTQELKDQKTGTQVRKELVELEDRMRALEDREQSRILKRSHKSNKRHRRASTPSDSSLSSSDLSSSESSSDSSSSDSDSSSDNERPRRKKRKTKGIKVSPDYILHIDSSLREWGDWKKEVERVFEGDPRTFRKGRQKILKALDYVDKPLKTLWYTHHDQKDKCETKKWETFLKWTKNNIQNGQNATAMLYERYEAAKQKPN